MRDFFTEMSEGEIHIRDKYQFELKNEYVPSPVSKKHDYRMDFYFFVPEALHIHHDTYSTKQFYQDVTCFIRFKTPDFSFRYLTDLKRKKSPLARINNLCVEGTPQNEKEIQREVKLFANIVRSRLRKEIAETLERMQQKKDPNEIIENVITMCDEIKRLRKVFVKLKEECFAQFPHKEFQEHWNYADEFISITVEEFFTEFLSQVRKRNGKIKEELNPVLCDLIAYEYQYRKKHKFYPAAKQDNNNETFIYRKGLLNKFILDPLFLSVARKVTKAPYTYLAAVVAAGIAMFLYVFAILWGFDNLLVNSTPFIVVSVLLYIIKDRLKEEIKNWFAVHVFVDLPDYTTLIQSPDATVTLVKLEETFTYIEPKLVPKEIHLMRAREFHQELVEVKRLEKIFRYSKHIVLNHQFFDHAGRHYELIDSSRSATF